MTTVKELIQSINNWLCCEHMGIAEAKISITEVEYPTYIFGLKIGGCTFETRSMHFIPHDKEDAKEKLRLKTFIGLMGCKCSPKSNIRRIKMDITEGSGDGVNYTLGEHAMEYVINLFRDPSKLNLVYFKPGDAVKTNLPDYPHPMTVFSVRNGIYNCEWTADSTIRREGFRYQELMPA